LAESVSSNDYDWFTPADLTRVIDAIHALPDWKSVVLVGGQSLTAWVEYYKIKLPTLEGPYLTIDADFLGTKTEAEAQTSAGVFVWQQWDVDVIAAVDASKMPGQFNRSWTHELAEVARKKEIANRMMKKIPKP
jgi:hypothetical protein